MQKLHDDPKEARSLEVVTLFVSPNALSLLHTQKGKC